MSTLISILEVHVQTEFSRCMSAEWFHDWFDSPYYHKLYHYRDEAEADLFIRNLAEYLNLPKSSRILDIACGQGRHASILRELGYEVTGIDLSENNIHSAKKMERKGLNFICHDKRKIFKKSGFELGLNLFTSFGYSKDIDDLKKSFLSMTSNVTPGGYFVIDYFNSEQLRSMQPSDEKMKVDEVLFNIRKYVEDNRIVKDIEVVDQDETYCFQESVQLLNRNDFENMFTGGGFEILHTFGDYNLRAFNPKSSDRLIIIAKRIE